eukprot:4745148-Pleurochrysis_carterae.AAC.1
MRGYRTLNDRHAALITPKRPWLPPSHTLSLPPPNLRMAQQAGHKSPHAHATSRTRRAPPCVSSRLREEVPDARGADAHKHLDEVGAGHGVEGRLGLRARNGKEARKWWWWRWWRRWW